MSVKLTTQDLTGAAVGKTGVFDWTPYVQVRSQAMPQEPSAHLMVRNDTGAALDVRFPLSGKSNYISPGQWPTFSLAPDETGMTYTVESIIAGGNYAKLAAVYYAPGEELDDIGSLGNSPLSGNVTSQFSPSNEFEQDFVTGFVLTGLVGSKDLVTVNQLDVTAGVAFLKQADSGWGRVAPLAATFLTVTPSTTYFLDLNPDGTFSFATSHSAVSNHLTICSLTTDGSGNILVVTDARVLNTTLFTSMLGGLQVPPLLVSRGGSGVMGTLAYGDVLDVDSLGSTYVKAATGRSITFQIPNGNTIAVMGSNGGFSELAGQMTAGSFGVPVVIGSATDQAVTSSTAVNFATGTTPNDGKNHLVRFCGAVVVGAGATNNGVCTFQFHYIDPGIGNNNPVAPLWNGSSVVAFAAQTVVKGGLAFSTMPTEYPCAPNSTVFISYQNTAAGTISDKISGSIELLT